MNEKLYSSYRQSFEVKRVLYEEKTTFQKITAFESVTHGKVLMLDGVVQLTERDEYIYHEMLVHVPMLSHPKPLKVLIIGGGDGGALQRVLMHSVTNVTLVDIDKKVIAASKKYFPCVCKNSFTDPRVHVLHEDGAEYVKNCTEVFDLIITDRGDPMGPVQTLFEKVFYQNCNKCLKKDGILVSLTGVPFMQGSELQESMLILKSVFKINTCYLVPVPTYVGGTLAITWSSNSISPQEVNFKTLKTRYKKLVTNYYNPEIHLAAFALPNFIKKMIAV